MAISALDLEAMVRCGASVIINAKDYSTNDIILVVSSAKEGQVTLKNAVALGTSDLIRISSYKNVILDFTKR